jgi:hypothetical protein
MKRKAICFILLFITCNSLFAQTPNWVVNENEYQFTMTFVSKLNVEGKQLINSNDRVAAFVGNTCRGVSGVSYVASKNSYYAFLTVFSNLQGEAITFKLYEKLTNKTTSVSKPITFIANGHKGDLFQSFSIAEPALNNIAEITSFNFMGIPSLSSIINSGTVKINISETYPLLNLKPVFILSKGATLFENGILQKSGEVTKNFSSVISYDVLSEDESVLNNYKVSVSQVINPTLFYKKDAVCYARGGIRVVSKQEGALVQVTSNGKTVASKQITNGEAIFTELIVGSYIATLGNDWKIINILLKEK